MILPLPVVHLSADLPLAHACPEPNVVPDWYDRCGPCPQPVPLASLRELAIVGWPIDGHGVDTLGRIDLSGFAPGSPVSIDVLLDARPWSLWAIVRKSLGPWSCQGTGISWGPWPVGVPIAWPGVDRLPRFYDVAGRRLPRPPPSGIYWVRVAGETRKRMVLR